MKYQLVYIEKMKKQVKEFDTIWDALKEAIRMLEASDNPGIKGIKCGDDLLGEPAYVLRGATVNSIWLLLANCPDGYWRE